MCRCSNCTAPMSLLDLIVMWTMTLLLALGVVGGIAFLFIWTLVMYAMEVFNG